MADNVIKAIIEVDSKAAVSGLAQVSTAVAKSEASLKKVAPASDKATFALTNLSRVAQDAPYGFIGIANNLNPLLESFQRLKAETGSTKTAFQALASGLTGPAGIGLALGVASSLLVAFGGNLFSVSKAAEKAKNSADEFANSISSAFKNAGKEASEVNGLIAVLKSETETRERKLAAIKELQRIQPEVFGNLRLEKDAVVGLDTAYKNYITNLRSVIQADILRAKLNQLITKQLETQGSTATGIIKDFNNFKENVLSNAKDGKTNALAEIFKVKENQKNQVLSRLDNEIKDIFSQLQQVTDGIKLPPFEIKPPKVDKDKIRKTFLDLTEFDRFGFKNRKPLDLGDIPVIVKPKIKLNLSDKSFNDLVDQDLKSLNDGISSSISDFLNSSTVAGLSSIGEAIGAALSGGNIGNVFAGFANSIASGLQELGKQFIQFGVIAKIAKNALKTLFTNPLAAVAAGIGLIAAGSALKGALGRGITGARALGGPVGSGGSYLVGERGPEIFTPNVNGSIIPNGRMGNYSGGSLMGQVQFVISGNNLVGVLSSANRSQGRLG